MPESLNSYCLVVLLDSYVRIKLEDYTVCILKSYIELRVIVSLRLFIAKTVFLLSRRPRKLMLKLC